MKYLHVFIEKKSAHVVDKIGSAFKYKGYDISALSIISL